MINRALRVTVCLQHVFMYSSLWVWCLWLGVPMNTFCWLSI